MTKYRDDVERTYSLYAEQIIEATYKMNLNNINLGFHDIKRLERIVKKMTGDPKVKLIRNHVEWLAGFNRIYDEIHSERLYIKNRKIEWLDDLLLGVRKTKL